MKKEISPEWEKLILDFVESIKACWKRREAEGKPAFPKYAGYSRYAEKRKQKRQEIKT